jgi:hypothetical protein
LRVVVPSFPRYTPTLRIHSAVPSSRSARWHCIALPFSWLTIASQRQKTMKWPKEFVKIYELICQVAPLSIHFLSFLLAINY